MAVHGIRIKATCRDRILSTAALSNARYSNSKRRAVSCIVAGGMYARPPENISSHCSFMCLGVTKSSRAFRFHVGKYSCASTALLGNIERTEQASVKGHSSSEQYRRCFAFRDENKYGQQLTKLNDSSRNSLPSHLTSGHFITGF